MLFIQEQTSSLPPNFPWAPSLMPFSPRYIPVICQEIYRKFLYLKNGANTRFTILSPAFPINSTSWTSFHHAYLLIAIELNKSFNPKHMLLEASIRTLTVANGNSEFLERRTKLRSDSSDRTEIHESSYQNQF